MVKFLKNYSTAIFHRIFVKVRNCYLQVKASILDLLVVKYANAKEIYSLKILEKIMEHKKDPHTREMILHITNTYSETFLFMLPRFMNLCVTLRFRTYYITKHGNNINS